MIPSAASSTSRPNLDPDAPDNVGEEGEEMDVIEEDDSVMMAMMGVNGFGSTKVRPLLSSICALKLVNAAFYRGNVSKVIRRASWM